MTTLDEYLAAQRARRANYQKRYRARVMAKPDSAAHLRAKNAEHQRAYRDRLAAQRFADHRAQIAQHAQMIARYRAEHPGATPSQIINALDLAIEDYTRATVLLSELLK